MNSDFYTLENFEILPGEDPVDMKSDLDAEAELIQILQDFEMLQDPGIQELLRRIEPFSRLDDLFTIIHWSARDFVRHLGARVAARLAKSAFCLTRLAYVDNLVRFLQIVMSRQSSLCGFRVHSEHDVLVFQREINSRIPIQTWNKELRRVIFQEIHHIVTSDNPSSLGNSTFTGWSSPMAGEVAFVPAPPVVIPTEVVAVAKSGKTSIPNGHQKNNNNNNTRSARTNVIIPPVSTGMSMNIRTGSPSLVETTEDDTKISSGNDDHEEVEEDGGGSTNDISDERPRHLRNKWFLHLVFLVNIASALVAVRYGFNVHFMSSSDSFTPPSMSSNVLTRTPTQGKLLLLYQMVLSYWLGIQELMVSPCFSAPTTGSDSVSVGADIIGASMMGQIVGGGENSLENRFGWSVSLSSFGRILAVGSPLEEREGHVHVYKFNDTQGEWDDLGHVLRGFETDAEFGSSTDLSEDGQILAIGARNRDDGKGRVQVFQLYRGQHWAPKGRPLEGTQNYSNFGSSVCLSGDGNRLVASAEAHDYGPGAEDTGMVRVFELHLEDQLWGWRQLGSDLHGESPNEKFGFSTAISRDGDVLAVGAPFYNATHIGNDTLWRGRVQLFKWDSDTKNWVQNGKMIPGMTANERFGWSVDLSSNGKIVAVGAPFNDANGEASGQVRIYEHEGEEWKFMGGAIQGQDVGRWFGNSVCLSGNGTTIAIATWCDNSNKPKCPDGGVRVYRYNTTKQDWDRTGETLPGQTLYDPQSTSIAMSEDEMIVMTGLDDSGQSHVQVWELAAE